MSQYDVAAAPEDIKILYDIDLGVLGDRIRRARLEKKLSQRDLSSELFTSAYLSSLELGKTRPTYKTLVSLAERLGKSLDYFLRQTSAMGGELDEEQARILEVRLALLTAQTALEHQADERAELALDRVKIQLTHLSNVERAHYFYLRGRFCNLSNLPSEAISEFEEARRYLQQGYDQELEVLIEMGLGLAHYTQRRIMPALSHFLAGLEYVRSSQESAAQSLRWKVLVNAGNCYLLLNDWQQAIGAYQEALDNAKEVVDLNAQANLHYGLASAYGTQGDFQRACLNLGRCLQIYGQVENQTMLLTTHNHLAQIYAQTEQYDKAADQVSDALRIARIAESSDRCEEMNALVTLALVQQKQQNSEQAQTYIAQAMELKSRCSDSFHLSRLYRVAGELAGDLNDRTTAQSYFDQALAVLENTGLANSQAEVYHSYGQYLRTWGDLDRAFEFMEKAYRQRELGRANRGESDRK